MSNHFEPEIYQDLFQLPEFRECREVFFRAGWNPFLQLLQGYDEEISLIFAMGFNGKKARVVHLIFPVSEDSIACATKLLWEGDRCHKHWFVPSASHKFSLKPEFWHVTGRKGFHRSLIKHEYLNSLTVIIHLITCEGNFSVFKSYHLHLLDYFVDKKCLNFPLFFLRSLEKMSNQVRKNTINPNGILYHHSLIKLLILDHIKEWNHTLETFVFKVINPHLNIRKWSWYLHNHEASQTPLVEEKSPNVVHLDEDTSEEIPAHSTPISVEFVPLPWPRTRDHKEKFS